MKETEYSIVCYSSLLLLMESYSVQVLEYLVPDPQTSCEVWPMLYLQRTESGTVLTHDTDRLGHSEFLLIRTRYEKM